jgi:hypothetical protein
MKLPLVLAAAAVLFATAQPAHATFNMTEEECFMVGGVVWTTSSGKYCCTDDAKICNPIPKATNLVSTTDPVRFNPPPGRNVKDPSGRTKEPRRPLTPANLQPTGQLNPSRPPSAMPHMGGTPARIAPPSAMPHMGGTPARIAPPSAMPHMGGTPARIAPPSATPRMGGTPAVRVQPALVVRR